MRQRKPADTGLFGVAGFAVMAVLIAGCGEDPAPASTTASETTAPASSLDDPKQAEPSTTTPETTSETTTDSEAAPKSNGLCTSKDLKLSLGEGSGAAGTVWRPLRFTNTSGATCEIQGFPGVSYVAGDDGHQVGAAAYRDGSKGAGVTLRAGQTAHAPVGFAQVGNYDPADCEPTEVRGLRVYPPQETNSMYLPDPGTGCANEDLESNQLKVQTIQPGEGES
ncbi:MAG: DUF4232 domain-containing protein [Actinophytocola sp.]|nr:DUF4232 domain-containing protein [Actinophytocola sp.]